MLELIFQGMIEWLYGLILEMWEYFFSVFTGVLSVDFDYLKLHIPIIPEIMKIMLAAGWALLLGNLVFQAMKSMMTGLGFEGEDPKLLFTRSFVFSFLLFASPQICRLGLDLPARVLDRLGAVNAVNVNLIDADTFAGMGAAWLLTIIINLVLMFRLIRLLLKIVEQYLVIAFLTICAPLAFGVGGSKNTADIFTGWCRMFASMCFLMVSNMTCFKMLLSLLGNVPVGADIFLWIALVFGVVRLAYKVDAIITRIGLNPAITGDGLSGRSLPGILAYTVMRTMVTQAVRTAGGEKGGAGQNGGTNSSAKSGAANHSGHSAGTRGQGTGNAVGTAGRSSGSVRTGSNRNTGASASQSGQRQANRPEPIIPDDSEDAAMNGPAPGNTVNTSTQVSGGERAKGAERKTSVPPGATRSPSVVRQSGNAPKSSYPAGTSSSSASASVSNTQKPATQAHGGPGTSKQENPGARETRFSQKPASTAGLSGDTPNSGAAGTEVGIPAQASRVNGGTRSDLAGTAYEARSRFTNAPHMTLQSAVQSSSHMSSSASGTSGTGQQAKPERSTPAATSKQGDTGAKEARYSQRPAASGERPPYGTAGTGKSDISAGEADRGTTSHTGTTGMASPAPHPSYVSGVNSHNPATQSDRPKAVGLRAESAQAAANVPHLPSGKSEKAASPSPAKQDTPLAHSPGVGNGEPRKAAGASAARQETRSPRTGSIKSGTAHGTVPSAPVRQESRTGRSAGEKPGVAGKTRSPAAVPQESRTPRIPGTGRGVAQKVTGTAPAQQENRLSARTGADDRADSPGHHPGAAETDEP